MNDKIIIQNKNIARYVRFMLKKVENEFTEEELKKISEIIIDYNEESVNKINLEELLLFKNLKSLKIRNGFIDNEYFEIFLNFNKLETIYFEKCVFENDIFIGLLNIVELSLINCDINNYSFIYILNHLKKLSIINGIVDINIINKLGNLNSLELSFSEILNSNKELILNNLNELYIDNTNIVNLSFINKLNNLKELRIDDNQYLKNKTLIMQLLENNVKVFDENMLNIVGESSGL